MRPEIMAAMAQVKIYGLRDQLDPVKRRLSDAIHAAVVEALAYPLDKRAHRFFPLERDDFFYPAGRTDRYTIVEISMFEGRTMETKKRLIRLLFERVREACGIGPADFEVTIFETPRGHWGFRGLPGDEHVLEYRVDV